MKESRSIPRIISPSCMSKHELLTRACAKKQALDGRAEERGIQDKRTVFNRCDRAVISSRKKEPADAGSFAL